VAASKRKRLREREGIKKIGEMPPTSHKHHLSVTSPEDVLPQAVGCELRCTEISSQHF